MKARELLAALPEDWCKFSLPAIQPPHWWLV